MDNQVDDITMKLRGHHSTGGRFAWFLKSGFDTKAIDGSGSLPILKAPLSYWGTSFMLGGSGIGEFGALGEQVSSLTGHNEILNRVIPMAFRGSMGGLASAASPTAYGVAAGADQAKQAKRHSDRIQNVYDRTEKINATEWDASGKSRLQKIRTSRFFRMPYVGGSPTNRLADYAEMKKLYELRSSAVKANADTRASKQAQKLRQGFDSFASRDKEYKAFIKANEKDPKAIEKAYKDYQKDIRKISSEHKDAFSKRIPYLKRGGLTGVGDKMLGFFMPQSFQTNAMSNIEKAKLIWNAPEDVRNAILNPNKNWTASLNRVTVDPIRQIGRGFKMRAEVGGPVLGRPDHVVESTLQEYQHAKRFKREAGRYVGSMADQVDNIAKETGASVDDVTAAMKSEGNEINKVNSMLSKYGPKTMERLGGYLNMGFSAWMLYDGKDQEGLDRLTTGVSVGMYNAMFATGMDNHLTKGWHVGKRVGAFAGQSAFTGGYNGARAGGWMAKGAARTGYSFYAGLGGQPGAGGVWGANVAGRTAALTGKLTTGTVGGLGKVMQVTGNLLGHTPLVGGVFRPVSAAGGALNTAARAANTGASYIAGANAQAATKSAARVGARGAAAAATGVRTGALLAGQGTMVGGAAILGGLAGFLLVGLAGEIPGAIMRSMRDAGRENRMMQDLAGAPYQPNSHMMNPYANAILATERQKALAFSRQSGANLRAAVGQEATVFHQ